MDNLPDNHQDLLDRCEFHLGYLGCGIFIELVKRQHPLIVVDSTEDIKMIELRCLTFDEEETLNSVIKRGLGRAIGLGDKAGKPFVKDIVVKQEPVVMIDLDTAGISGENESRADPGRCQSESEIDLQNRNNEMSVLGTDPGKLPEIMTEVNIHRDTGELHIDNTVNSSSVPGRPQYKS